VLHREDREQREVDREGLAEGKQRLRVDRLRHEEVADEPDHVQERAEEHDVAQRAVREYRYPFHFTSSFG
jgi:hypothetical protein